MTRYGLIPVGAHGLEKDRAVTVEIPSRFELMRENDQLRRRIEDLERDRARVQRWRGRREDEVRLRVEAQDRLNKAMRVVAVIAQVYPQLRPVIERARKDIWG